MIDNGIIFQLVLLCIISLVSVSSFATDCEISTDNPIVAPIDPVIIAEVNTEKLVPYQNDFTNINPLETHTSFEFHCQTGWPKWNSSRRLKPGVREVYLYDHLVFNL
jgi:hypothetical protein